MNGDKRPPMPRHKLEEKERRGLIRHWENQRSPNPDFKGATPKDVARALLRQKPPKPVPPGK